MLRHACPRLNEPRSSRGRKNSPFDVVQYPACNATDWTVKVNMYGFRSVWLLLLSLASRLAIRTLDAEYA